MVNPVFQRPVDELAEPNKPFTTVVAFTKTASVLYVRRERNTLQSPTFSVRPKHIAEIFTEVEQNEFIGALNTVVKEHAKSVP